MVLRLTLMFMIDDGMARIAVRREISLPWNALRLAGMAHQQAWRARRMDGKVIDWDWMGKP